MSDDRRLSRWLAQTLYFDVPDEFPGTRTDEASAHVLAEVFRRAAETTERARVRRRRQRWGMGLGVAALLSGGAAVAAGVLWGDGQPTQVEQGVRCHADLDPTGRSAVLSASDDPIGACAALWARGRIGAGGAGQPVPPLVACISTTGTVDVYPGEDEVCDQLGLQPADPTLSPTNRAVLELNDRVVNEINLAPCRPVSEVEAVATRMLDATSLIGWHVVVSREAAGGACGQIAVHSPTQTLIVVDLNL